MGSMELACPAEPVTVTRTRIRGLLPRSGGGGSQEHAVVRTDGARRVEQARGPRDQLKIELLVALEQYAHIRLGQCRRQVRHALDPAVRPGQAVDEGVVAEHPR